MEWHCYPYFMKARKPRGEVGIFEKASDAKNEPNSKATYIIQTYKFIPFSRTIRK